MQPNIQRIEQDETVFRKQPRKQLSERATVRLFGAVTFSQEVRQLITALAAEQRRCLPRHLFHLRAQGDLPHRLTSLRRDRQLKPFELAGFKPGRVADFLQVVIFRRHPEDGHRAHARSRQFFGQLNRRQRLVNGVGRSAEQSHLLSGYDRDSALLEPTQIFQSGRARAESFVLRAQSGNHFSPSLLRKLQLSRLALHPLHRRWMRIKRRNAGKAVNELEKELRLVG